MKKLIIFIFSVVLLGSCAKKQKVVKFSLRTNLEPQYSTWYEPFPLPGAPSSGEYYGYECVEFSYSYSSANSTSNASDQIQIGYSNYSNQICNNTNLSYVETSDVSMYEGDNVSLSLIINRDEINQNGTYEVKAYVGNNEYIIWNNTYLSNNTNWIVP